MIRDFSHLVQCICAYVSPKTLLDLNNGKAKKHDLLKGNFAKRDFGSPSHQTCSPRPEFLYEF
jgi:hypothetical protein